MKLIKDKSIFRVSKEEVKKVNGTKNMRKALKMANINKGLLSIIIILFVFGIAISIASAIVTKDLLSFFTNGEYEKFTLYAIFTLAIDLAYYLHSYVYDFYFDKFKKELNLNLNSKTYERITSLKASCFSNNQTSTFTRRLSDSSEIVASFSILFNIIGSITTSIAYCVVLLISSPVLFGICTVFYVAKIIVNKIIIPKHNVIRRRIHKLADNTHNIALESIRGANDIKSLNLSDELKSSFDKSNREFMATDLTRGVWWRNRIMPNNFFAFSVNAFVFIILVGYFLSHNVYEAGAILFFWTYKGHINNFFRNLFEIKEQFSNVEVSASRMMDLFDENLYPSEKFGEKEIDVKGNIEFKNVQFSYEKGKKILDKVSFNIEANKITAIVGKTGCGKSTTLSLIARFYDSSSGTIKIDGTNVKQLTKNCLRSNIGYVQQNPYIFNRSFKENLLLVKPNATDEEIMDACKKSEIHDFIMETKDKYDTKIGENGITLSGGQKQRLAIARALLGKAKIIMFDESTSSLDNENQAKIQATIENLSESHTIIVVAHRLSTIINADKIIFMEDHKVKAEGTHKELFETCDEYKNLYEIENI